MYLYDHLGTPAFTVSEEAEASAAFGCDVAVDGDRLAVGLNVAYVGGQQYAGEVYLYELKPVEQITFLI